MKNLKFYMMAVIITAGIANANAQYRDNDSGNGSDDEIVTLLGSSNHVGGYGAFR
ncbi:MAG: hypothetical protein HC905_03445 [Bacteroidales bacterium]|nr:hypothetical protein [Bacteroidales bacterium]